MIWLLTILLLAIYYFLVKNVNFFSFDGRISRANYWWIYLFYSLGFFGYYFLLNTFAESFFGFGYRQSGPDIVIIGVIFYRALRLPIDVRRCHDINYSGWHSILLLIPILGLLILLANFTRKGTDGKNKYGKNPLYYRRYMY